MTKQQQQSGQRNKIRLGTLGFSAVLLSEVILGNISGLTPMAEAAATPVNLCFKTGSELDLNQTFNSNTKAKLTNSAYFGMSGTAAPETFNFISIATITSSALTSNNCQIYFGGGSLSGTGTDDLTTTEVSALANWLPSIGRFIIAGCDYANTLEQNNSQICSAFRTRTIIANGGVNINSALSYNPLTCGGALSVATFGGVSSYFTTVSGDSVLATHNSGGQPAAITDSLVSPKFLFTGDADMYGNSGSTAIGTGGTASSDQAKLVVNSFKFALDAIMGRLSAPQCFSSYDLKSDLELGITTSNATPSLNGQTTVTVTVFNRGPNSVTGVAADIALPAGLSVVSQTGTGSYSTANRTWTIGSLATNTTATITLTLNINSTGSYSIPARIIQSSLADVDSATNAGFGVDDLSDGIADDDEATVTITSVLDFGDAPNSYGTSLASNGARHSISGGIYLGTVAPDGENDASIPLDGTGDGAQDDGVALPPSIAAGSTISIPVRVTGAGALNAWFDWNGNGSFDTGEQIAANAIDGGSGDTDGSANGTITLGVSVPSGATVGTSYARFRYSSQTGLTATGLASNGEVEDYQVAIAASAPLLISPELCPVTSYLIQRNPSQISIYNLATGQFGSFTTITGVDSGTVLNGAGFNALDGHIYAIEDFGTNADKDIYKINQSGNATKVGQVANLDFSSYNAGDIDKNGYYYVTKVDRNLIEIIDVNPARTATYGTKVGEVTIPFASGPDLAINPVDGRIYTIQGGQLRSFQINMANPTNPTISSSSSPSITVSVPITVAGAAYFDVNGNFYAYDNSTGNLWKFPPTSPTNPTVSTTGQLIGNGGTTTLNDGARCALAPVPSLGIDYGDAPDTGSGTGTGNYQTLNVDNGPFHGVSNGFQLGNSVTSDSDGFVNGVDNNLNATDDSGDDGVQLSGSSFQGQALTAGSSITLNLSTQGSGVLNAWIDWNGNGSFEDAGEKIATNVSPTTNAIALNVNVPSGARARTTYARFRFSSDANLLSTGYASDGEVEDYQVTINAPSFSLSGIVFEDPNYGGGAGRPLSTASTSPRQNATVELYNSTGNFVSSTTTNSSGQYSFTTSPGNYYVRVVNSTVTSSRAGYVSTLVPVQTFRTNATTGSAVSDPNRVGGEQPSVVDTGAAASGAVLNTSNFTFSTGAGAATTGGQAESIAPVTVSSGAVAGVDFGFNFGTIVNTNDSGQGSLRQFITNSNALTGESSLSQSGTRLSVTGGTESLPNGKESSIFMIPATSLTSGVAVISPTTILPTITGTSTYIDATTQTVNIGNTNTSTLGSSLTVGTGADGRTGTGDEVTLNPLPAPEVQLVGQSSIVTGLNNSANDFAVRGISIYGFGSSGTISNFDGQIVFRGSQDFQAELNALGVTATSVSPPPVIGANGIGTMPSTAGGTQANITIRNNLIANQGNSGIYVTGQATGAAVPTTESISNVVINNNVLLNNGSFSANTPDGVTLEWCGSGCAVTQNYIDSSFSFGVQITRSTGLTITDNTITNSGRGNTVELSGIGSWNNTQLTVTHNILANNKGAGILVSRHPNVNRGTNFTQRATISANSTYNNGNLGIDLFGTADGTATADFQNGVSPYVTPNDGIKEATTARGNVGMDYPIITSASLSSGTLTVKGYVGNDATGSSTFANSTLEFFIAADDGNNNGKVFSSDPASVSKPHGEGKTYLGTCTTDGNGLFNCSFANADTLGLASASNITSTATDTQGNTSEFSSVPLSNIPNLLLVKRITAINGLTTNPNDGTVLNAEIDSPSNPNDDAFPANNWPSDYLVGATNGGVIKPGDEIEYTVYFLSSGNTAANDVRICDRIQSGQTFQLGADPTRSAAAQLRLGSADTQLQLGTSLLINLTAASDPGVGGDRAQFISAGTTPSNCNLSAVNDNGILIVDITGAANSGSPTLTELPNSTGQGTPNNSYGFFRFITKIDE